MKLKNLRVRLLKRAALPSKRGLLRNKTLLKPAAPTTVVPWKPVRGRSGELRGVYNRSQTPLQQVRVYLAGAGAFAQSLPVTVAPREMLCFRVGQAIDSASQTLVVRWISENGEELLWSVPVH